MGRRQERSDHRRRRRATTPRAVHPLQADQMAIAQLHKEIREALMEIQHVLNDEDEAFPRSKADLLCDAVFLMVNEHQHEPEKFEGWATWREYAYAELGELDSMPTRNYLRTMRAKLNKGDV
jgi:hypothetical protein